MLKGRRQFKTIDGYIRTYPVHVQRKLSALRRIIRSEAPGAREKISYQMPAFELNGNLVYFAAYAGHIGFYPTSSGIRAFKSKLSKYKNSKGAVQFPIDEPLPVRLIRQMVRFRVAENVKRKTK